MGRKRASTSSKEEPLEERRNMNLPFELIPRYDPDEGLSYDNWSRLFDHQAQQQGLSSKESLSMMPMLFKGKALEMYALICRDISSLEELHSRMKRFFHEPEHGLHRKFWQELILEGLTSGIESEFERFLIAASPTSLERWLEIAEAIEISHCRTTSSASGMEMGYPARRRPSTSWQGGQGFRTRNWREGRNDRPGTHLPPTRSQTASLAAVQDHEENEESHLKHLGQIFEILRKEGIQLRRDKCLLFMKRITYLGYEISENQISPSGVNVDVIKSLPPPRDLRCLRSFLGSVTHYAKFINNFNNLRAPLNELLKKNSRFIWTEECQRSFEGLKEALCSKPILQLFNPSLATHIYCDASTSGIGAVLKQEYPDGTQKPFTYFSRALRGAESKYTITELELLAVVETCKRYHPYISGSHVIVHTDHKALIWLNSFKHTNGRLFRWSLKLSEYDLDFNYNKGCENHEADMLSRLPYSYFLSAQALKQNQGDLSIPPSKLYSIVDGITYIRLNNKDRVVVPPELQDDLIQKAHESLGHPGISAMIRALSVQYYFKGMIGKIKNYVKNCKECQTIKSSTQPSYGLMGSLPRAAKPFDVVALDTVLGLGGYNSAKNCVHTVIDHHSRYIWGYASKGTSIATYINIINQLLNIGKPRILVTDRHPSFVSKRFNKFLQEKGIKHVMTSPSHPECNGLVERANATLIGRLKIQHQVERARTIANEKTEELHKRDLGMRRVAAKFVPKLLNCDQKQHRMNIANEMLDSVRDDPNLLQRVITGDEAWVYGYDVETKAQSSQWKLPHEPRPKKARQVRSNVKVLLTVFFDCRGVVHHEFLPQGRTVNKEYYLQVMRNLREAIRQKRPDLWKNKNWLLHHDNAPAHTSLLVRDFLAKTTHNDAAATVFPRSGPL
ncbi:hypothetical protein LAZ67_17001493 [Cordylochernes scorpioides]|uniref:RNA-directed DNA polymerase n=1 Tax=Cordylochernes scorpioides TaxID=51811 RepID=A0ABY6LG82_9ARAC|nr:hypothetical protein LAZ67_17001493 [Cordylochernes scorpioides]